ncbi:glucan 1,4-alpha-glucosidase [Nocardioides sp. KR10-350]|uniref:glucan 1,4-alpha-glucosidase n=1 Tax=Nocardioides cheoyonin TaxID=3156615 RepID=UPI0032B517F0
MRRASRWSITVASGAVVLAGLAAPAGAAQPSASPAAPPAASPAAEATAPGAPGASSTWTTGAKDGIGTSTTTSSKVWFSLTQGVLSEVYYPRVDVADSQGLQLVVTDGRTFTDREDTDTTHRIRLLDPHSLSYQQVNTDKQRRYRITKTYVTDPARDSVVVSVRVTSLDGGRYSAYVLYDPSLANSGKHDSATTHGGALLASDTTGDTPVASALVARPAFTATSSGYAGSSDGWTDLADDHTLDHRYTNAPDGNVVQLGRLASTGRTTSATVVLGFGADTATAERTARTTLRSPFGRTSAAYRSGWSSYLRSLKRPPRSVSRDRSLETQYDVAVMTLKAHEDKTYRGANIASLTVPWGEAVNADEPGVGGYHLVWARDLYQVATAQLAAGDSAAANRSLDYLFDVQQKPDGSFPQNSLLDGTPYWGSLQLDEVAFPIVLAQQLGRSDAATWGHVKRAADFLVGRGPSTPQERWEEEGGYSPSTIAAEIAGLVCAASIARANGDDASAGLYLATADDWRRHVADWTFTTTGPLGDHRYFERIDDNGDPNDGHSLEINNGGGTYDERGIVDAGFLDLVRLGVLPADDPDVLASLPEVDSTIRVVTPDGPMWYRYNHDGYGEKPDGSPYDGTGQGRLWPLLSGERGEYALASGQSAGSYLRTMAGAANDGYMIPEQVWDEPSTSDFTFGEGTGSATPLAWSMAQYVRLAQSIDAGKPVETPSVVAQRYAGVQPAGPSVELTSPDDGLQTDAATVEVAGTTDAASVSVNGGGSTVDAPVDSVGHFSVSVPLSLGSNVITVAAVGSDGGTTLVRRTVVSTSLGTRLGTVSDPSGDDDGPGTYVYPTSADFVPGAFDVTGFGVYEDPEQVNFAITIRGDLTSPWGGNQISVQRFDIYLRTGSGSGAVAALPGTNAELEAPYDRVITADGWGPAVRDGSGATLGTPTLTGIAETHTLVVSVPRDLLPSDLSSASYALTSMSHADEAGGEGVGGIRPVYALDYWQNPPAGMEWIQQYRFGGGAGQWTGDNAAKDTDTPDPNVLDILVPSGSSQADVLDWTSRSPVVLPYVPLG